MTAAIENTVASTGTSGIGALGRASSGGSASGGFAEIYASQLVSTTATGSSTSASSSPAATSGLGEKESRAGSVNSKNEEKKSLAVTLNAQQPAPVQVAIQLPVPVLTAEPIQIAQATNMGNTNGVLSDALSSTSETVNVNPALDLSGSAEKSLTADLTLAFENSSSVDSLGLFTPNKAVLPFVKSAHNATTPLSSSSQRPNTDSLPVASAAANLPNMVVATSLSTAGVSKSIDAVQSSENLAMLSAQPSSAQINSVPDANLSMLMDNATGHIANNGLSNVSVGSVPSDSSANVGSAGPSDNFSTTNATLIAQDAQFAKTALNPVPFITNDGSAAEHGTHANVTADYVSENGVPAVTDFVTDPKAGSAPPNVLARAFSPATSHISEKFPVRAVEFLSAIETLAADAPARVGAEMRANLPASPILASSHASQTASSSSVPLATAPSAVSQNNPEHTQSHAVPAIQSANSSKVTEQSAPVGKESQSGKQGADSQSFTSKPLTAPQPVTLPDAPTPSSSVIGADVALPVSANLPASSASITAGNTNADHSKTAPGLPSSPAIAELPAALPAGPVQMAQMVSKAAESEMRIGLTTPAFGNVEVRAIVHANDVGVLIGSEKGDLRALLTHDLPGIADTLQQQNLRLAQVSFQHGFSFSNQMSSGGESQPRSYSSKITNPALPMEVAKTGPAELLEDSGARQSGLSILA